MVIIMKKQKVKRKNQKVKGAKVRKLNALKKKSNEFDPVVPLTEDKFADDETQLNADAVKVIQPADWDVRDELEQMDGFRDYLSETRGNTLSYGDY